VVFVGTFTAGRLQLAVEDGRLRIANDGTVKKFVREVEHRTFSGSYAAKRGQPVLYVTERCVFEFTPEGLELVDVAPGVDIERDILAQMEFRPIIRRDPAIMDKRIFLNEPMGLRDDLLRMPLEQRLHITRRKISSLSTSKAMWFAANAFGALLNPCFRPCGKRST
jgi:propionate CoA-transferase